MRDVFHYFKARWALVVFGAAAVLLIPFVAYLGGQSVALGWYTSLMLGFVLLLLLFFDGRRYIARLRLMRTISVHPGALPEALPAPQDALEKEYQAVIRTLVQRQVKTNRALETAQDENLSYYTLWVHQIKTPIAAMRLLLQSGEGAENRALSDELQRIEQYVEMVLGYLRLESGSSDYVIRAYDLDGIVRQAVRKFASQFISKKLRLDYEPVRTEVLTDEKWLLFVIEQVLSNALKYTRTGGIAITLEEPKTLCIRDTGIGIAPEDLPRVFEQGFTGYHGRDDKRATGIGLYLCRRILTRLGHTITIESEPGVGTTVRIGLDREPFTVE